MARRRFFVHEVRNGQAELEGDEARHLTQVLRVEAGQVYEISDNDRVYLAEVDLARKQHVIFRTIEPVPAKEPSVPVVLFISLIKFERLETIIEKATELGVAEIRLVKAERSEKGLDVAAPKRMHRWGRIALESSQQSRRVKLPVIHEPVPLRTALEFQTACRLFLDEEREGETMLDVLRERGPAAVLVGPEGGWTAGERQQASDAGWHPASLGPLILRSETAAIAALATLNSFLYRLHPD
jgi:16S rRNA (uracil1498-N3)-methyltransferase